ncbi:hypothetical protein RB597_007323 [Gaeumannomyces tritici]
MAWVAKMSRAKAYMETEREERAAAVSADAVSVLSASDDDNTLPGDDDFDFDDGYLSDDASSLWSYPFGRDADPIQLSPPFRLPREEDPLKPVYEGWTIHVSPKEEDVTDGKRVLGIKTVQHFTRNPGGRPSVLFTTHTQKELATMHMDALDEYHGSHRSSGGCLPVRRLLRRHTSRSSYDDNVDERIRKLPAAVQDEISTLLQDRGRCSSSATRKREFTVAIVREQLHHHFASTEPTPARRHRLRWWKDNTRGRELQYFLVLIGRQTQHDSEGLPAYTRLTNPWREVDIQQGHLERAKKAADRQKAGFFAPPSVKIRRTPFAPPTLRRRAPSERYERRARSPLRDRSRSRSRSIEPPRRCRWRSRSPSSDPSLSSWGDRSRSPSRDCYTTDRRPYRFPPPPGFAPPPPHPFSLPPYAPFQQRSALLPPPPPPGLPMPQRCAFPSRPPILLPGPMAPPPPAWSMHSLSTPPPPPPPPASQPGAFFAPGSMPPSTSWPSSPNSQRNALPLSLYGPPPPPPPMNPFSALTTPSSLGSFHLPMFGPIPLPPPPPRSNSNRSSANVSRTASPLGKDNSLPRRGGEGVMSDNDFMNSRRPYVEDVDDEGEEDATLIGLNSSVAAESPIDKAPASPEVTAREDAKVLASDKPGIHGDD